MNAITQLARGWFLRGVALLTLLGMILAPLCVPLCATGICAGAAASESSEPAGCHSGAAASTNVSQVSLHSQKSCTATAPPVVALGEDQTYSGIRNTDVLAQHPSHLQRFDAAGFVKKAAFEYRFRTRTLPQPTDPALNVVLLI